MDFQIGKMYKDKWSKAKMSMCDVKKFLTFTSLSWYCYDNCFSQPTISFEMPVPSQGHHGFHSFPVVD
jgi:hypothetical protein